MTRLRLTMMDGCFKAQISLGRTDAILSRLSPNFQTGLISVGTLPIMSAPQRTVARSSRGPGRRPLTPVTRVRIPYGLPRSSPPPPPKKNHRFLAFRIRRFRFFLPSPAISGQFLQAFRLRS